MSQVDNTVFLSIILSLFKCSFLFYSIFLVFLFHPFISRIKVLFNFFSKIRVAKHLLSNIKFNVILYYFIFLAKIVKVKSKNKS